MSKMLRIGMMTPSSNTILEPMTQRMLRDMSHVSTHFSRLRVTEVSLAEQADGQFGLQQIVESAELLSDAKVHVMGWNATSASWRGFDTDKLLCSTLSQRYGIPATTAVLAVNELLNLFGIRRFALVTPYLKNVQDKIIDNYRDIGYECIAERHLAEADNYAFGEVSEDVISSMVREVSVQNPDAVVIMCTNLKGAQLAPALEVELGVPIFDSVSAFVWQALVLGKVDPSPLSGWGRLFGRQRE